MPPAPGRASELAGLGLLCALVVAACGSSDPPADSGADADAPPGDASFVVVAAPLPPALPDFRPCPTGYVESPVEGGVTLCEPWATDTPRPTCADHEARFVGEPACARLGSACPADGLPADVPASAIFVSAGATSGDGTRAAPFGTITEALAAASAGDTLAIGIGEYDELLTPTVDVTLAGACVEGTRLRNGITNFDRGGISAQGGVSVTLTNLTVGPSEAVGVSAVGPGSVLTLRDVVIVESIVVGLYAELEGRIVGDGVAIRRTRATTSGMYGRGVSVQSAATAVLNRLSVEGGSEAGLYSHGPGTSLTVDRGSVLDVEAVSLGRASGLSVLRGASATLSNTILDGMVDAGVIASGEDVRVSLTNVIVQNVAGADMALAPGRGLSIQEGATFEGHGLVVRDVRESGLTVGTATATATDVFVDRVAPSPEEFGGRGLTSQTDATLDVTRVFIRHTHEAGLVAHDAVANLRDFTITDVLPLPAGIGRGIVVQEGATGALERGRIERTIEVGLYLSGLDTDLDVSDLVVDGVSSRPDDGALGRGISIQANASVALERVRVHDARDVALAAFAGATITGVDVEIEDVVQAVCAPSACGIFGEGGHALGAYTGGSAELTRFHLRRAALCGVHMTEGSVITLSDGEVSGAEIGACVQNADQPIDALSSTVRYRDNVQNLVTTSLPVPGGVDEIMP